MVKENPIDRLLVPHLMAGNDIMRPGDTVLVRLTVREIVEDFGKTIYIRTEAGIPRLRSSFWVQLSDIVEIERRTANR